MKLTNEVLEKMILEEMERLDEDFPFDASKLGIFGGNKNKTGETDAELKKRIAALAKLDQNAADITIDDMRIGATKPTGSDEHDAVLNVKVGGKNRVVRNIATQALAGKLPASTGIGGEKLGTGQDQQAAEVEPSAGESIPTMDMDYSAVDLKSDLQAKKLETKGKLDQAVVDALKTFFSIDPKKLGSNMAADTLGGRFDLLSKFATLVKADDTNTLKKLEPEELMAAAVAFKALASVFIQFQGASAGTVFETLIALITGGGIFGGESGAIDNIAGKNGDVYTSAKQYADKHHTAQATGTLLKDGGKGLIAHCQQAYINGKKVWYISAKKMERELEIIFGGISVDNPDNPTHFLFFKPDGTESGSKMKVKKGVSSAKNNFTKFIEAAAKGQEMRIPFVDANEARKVANVDKMIADALGKLNKAFLTAAMESSKEVDLLTKQNLSYTTEKDKTPSANKAAEIGKTYTRLKNAFNTMFGQKHQAQISEHKNEKLTEELLDKLIKAVIL